MAQPAQVSGDSRGATAAGRLPAGLFPALQRLDGLLAGAVAAAQAVYGADAAADRFRGLYIDLDEVTRLLARDPGVPLFGRDGLIAVPEAPALDPDGAFDRLAWLARSFGLCPVETDVILIALAPEIDLRYERLYAYLQDDVSRRRPSVDLVLNLLCPSPLARLAWRAHFAADAPLLRHRLIHLLPDPAQPQPPLLAHALALDEQVTRLLLDQEGLDARLARFARMVAPDARWEDLLLDPETERALPALAARAEADGLSLRLLFHGPSSAVRRRAAEALARARGLRLLDVDIMTALAEAPDFDRAMAIAVREAWLAGAVLYLDGVDALCCGQQPGRLRRLSEALAGSRGIAVLSGPDPLPPAECCPRGLIEVPFPIPGAARRRGHWQARLEAAGIEAGEETVEALAGRFHLTADQIAEAVVAAANRARWRAAATAGPPSESALPGRGDLFAAARVQTGHALAEVTRRIRPRARWDDLVLPDDAVAQLREVCARVARRQTVLDAWGFDRRLSAGKGTNALFAGPSGTGKTLAAEVVAGELGFDLYKIDLAGVVSKYIGETEKNLDRIFTAAEHAGAVLFFDEADALFGKRSEVRDSHDRYANIEISYLLQKMEAYDGVAILATNLRGNLDESFTRRLAFTVYFPFPDEAYRLRIWTGIWPAEAPLGPDVDLECLSRRFPLSGGGIKNVALAAAFLAAEDGCAVTMAHLLQGVRREYQKMGKLLTDAELTGAEEGAALILGGAR